MSMPRSLIAASGLVFVSSAALAEGPDLGRTATPEEIAENDFNLNIPRYVDTFEAEEEVPLLN